LPLISISQSDYFHPNDILMRKGWNFSIKVMPLIYNALGVTSVLNINHRTAEEPFPQPERGFPARQESLIRHAGKAF